MKDSKTLLLDYLASVRDPEHAASLFAEDGVFELPFLRSLGVEPRHTGRGEIAGLIHQLLETLSELRVRRRTIPVSSSRRRKRRSPSMWGTGAPLRPAERSINCSLGTWWPRLVRSNCCAKASIRWRWRRRNCRMERPISHHPATRCILSDRMRAGLRFCDPAYWRRPPLSPGCSCRGFSFGEPTPSSPAISPTCASSNL